MRRRLSMTLAVALFVAALSMAHAGGRITVDPNAGKTNESAEALLDKPISYSAVSKRFHDVTDDLAQLSGLSIYCGKDKNDWHVRDIPVDVAVKEMPLGKLLKALEWTTHTYCARVEHEGKAPSYRFYRDIKGKQALSEPQINAVAADWAWNVLSTYAGRSDASLKTDSKAMEAEEFNAEQMKLTADFIASLEPGVKQKVLDGEQVTLKVADLAQSGALESLYRSAWAIRKDKLGPDCREIEDGYVQRATVSLKLVPALDPGGADGFCVDFYPVPEKMGKDIETEGVWDAKPVRMAQVLQSDKTLNIPPCPSSGAESGKSNDAPPPGFRLLKKDGNDWWELPALQAKVDLKQLEQRRSMHLTDAVPILSKASGLNIICEDFVSQMQSNGIGYRDDHECTVGNVLLCATGRLNCYVDDKCTTILGQSDNWKKAHLSLVPESLIKSIQTQRGQDGAELDDVVAIAGFSSDQFYQWISSAPDPLCRMEPVYPNGRWMWRLYESLSASDKKRGKSEKGLSLSKFDPSELRDFIHQDSKDASKNMIALHMPFAEDQRQAKVLSDPETLKTLVMRVSKIPLDSWYVYPERIRGQRTQPRRVKQTSAEGIKRHTYEIRISGEDEDGKISLSSRWTDIIFPNYTREREAELLKELKANGK